MNFNDKNIKVTTASGLELNYFLVKVGRPGVWRQFKVVKKGCIYKDNKTRQLW